MPLRWGGESFEAQQTLRVILLDACRDQATQQGQQEQAAAGSSGQEQAAAGRNDQMVTKQVSLAES